MSKNLIQLIALLLLLSLGSCSTFSEVHYFKDKVGITDNKSKKSVSNYYRVKIKGYSFLSSSRYVSGYFNQDAVNLYFNEISQPVNGKLFNTTSVTNENGNELVLIFSTNAKAISDQIGNISKNQTILNSMAQLTQKDKIIEAEEIKDELSTVDSEIQTFILNTDLYLKNIETKSGDEIKKVIEQYTKTLLN
ncbi:hypothetical protein [Flavobacterium aquatile]|uniref:DUF4369 domain-containing protein n=1 Tax=Flavobacterium aquatile LMG 4008 = ATCC 11947 TaxID=1453498 RepID=A0A095TZ15_9FLAO|nr:hypothetical protein [Flavobacterium aquatile]KGD67578.1 hypothetical protein LG45_10585 [Flavobacterium aquatile LMG 4008 = ATCC 11947]OXA65490.1 hypothetical protein B0A61_14925 [Flavobacterium aquatile LMG 4008 = ATCC 11947]GEC80219.1 hypothetical protein FAQ01_30890 [Flavobacterium aquatile]